MKIWSKKFDWILAFFIIFVYLSKKYIYVIFLIRLVFKNILFFFFILLILIIFFWVSEFNQDLN